MNAVVAIARVGECRMNIVTPHSLYVDGDDKNEFSHTHQIELAM